jgi:hypothetical protein
VPSFPRTRSLFPSGAGRLGLSTRVIWSVRLRYRVIAELPPCTQLTATSPATPAPGTLAAAAASTAPAATHSPALVTSPHLEGGLLKPDLTLVPWGRLTSVMRRRQLVGARFETERRGEKERERGAKRNMHAFCSLSLMRAAGACAAAYPQSVLEVKDVASELDKLNSQVFECGCVRPHTPVQTHARHTQLTATALAAKRAADGLFSHPLVPQTMLHESVPASGPSALERYDQQLFGGGREIETAGSEEKGKKSVTDFRLLRVIPRAALAAAAVKDGGSGSSTNNKQYLSTDAALVGTNPLALYEVALRTGRTHQIRIHFSDAGCPVHVSWGVQSPLFGA